MAEMRIYNAGSKNYSAVNNNLSFKSSEKNTPRRRVQMIKILPVAVALSVAQPNPKISKDNADVFNKNNTQDYYVKKDAFYVRPYPLQEFNDARVKKAYEKLERFKKENFKPAETLMGTDGFVNTKLNIAKTRYYGNGEVFNKYFEGGVLEGKGAKFIELQKRYGVNAMFLAAVTLVESGGGKSNAAKTKYNVAGIMTRQGNKYVIKKFNNVDECIESLARNISKNYIGQNIVTIENINKKYAEDKNWGNSVVYHINKMLHTKA